MLYFGAALGLKLKEDSSYIYILCTDTMLFCLRVGPFLASILYSLVLGIMQQKLDQDPTVNIEDAKRDRRQKTINRLQTVTVIFSAISFYLIVWDLIRLYQNYGVSDFAVNCFGVSSNFYLNQSLWFLTRFFGS